ncbi:MAG: hypothetical protein KIS85_06365 [Anaerolineales bacterium]|nr:hypothetical protein [Anaerolineales bacterium]
MARPSKRSGSRRDRLEEAGFALGTLEAQMRMVKLLARRYPALPRAPENTVLSAVYANKIRRRGRGEKSELNVADYEKWLEAYKPREKKAS